MFLIVGSLICHLSKIFLRGISDILRLRLRVFINQTSFLFALFDFCLLLTLSPRGHLLYRSGRANVALILMACTVIIQLYDVRK